MLREVGILKWFLLISAIAITANAAAVAGELSPPADDAANSAEHLEHAATPLSVQATAVGGVIDRTVGLEAAKRFEVKVDGSVSAHSFTLSKSDTAIVIVASDGVSAAKGFHHYLKYALNVDVTWRNLEPLPATALPASFDAWPNVTLTSRSASQIVYYQNVCTWSYSFAWWTWEAQWRRHIDWMAMMGITLTLAPVQEELWHGVYTDLGLTGAELDDFFAGPAFQAWQRMGNLRGWAGPLPPAYRRAQLQLQQRIVSAERALGMSVAVPAFAGHVPHALLRVFPNASSAVSVVPRWNRFADDYCCPFFLEPSAPLFAEIAERFLRAVTAAYGSDHIYFADPFNENEPRQPEAGYLAAAAQHIYAPMRAHDPQAVWLLQGWMFVKNPFWTDELIAAFLTAVPQGHLLVLDLQSEQFPQYERTNSYHGQPFVWCMLHNFGGTLGMHGSAALVNRRIGEARRLPNSTMVGVGVAPEGIHQNYAMYALALERAWSEDDFELGQWFDAFADARYGMKTDTSATVTDGIRAIATATPTDTASARLRRAWAALQRSVYAYEGLRRLHGRYAITRRPGIKLDVWTWYELEDVRQAWSLLLQAAAGSGSALRHQPAFTHDLVDVTRQYLQALADRIYLNAMAAYRRRERARFDYNAQLLLALLDDLDTVLGTHADFLLGVWLAEAKRWGETPTQRRLFEVNARNQITAWGPHGQILDYATKQWAGVVRDYYRPRWAIFLAMLDDVMRNGTAAATFNAETFRQRVANEVENPFSIQTKRYAVEPVGGEPFDVAQRLHCKWTTLVHLDANFGKLTRLHVPIVNSFE